jgi:hypothetical protein
MSEWESIATAPKDGGDLILLSENGIRVAHWTDQSRWFKGWFIAMDGKPGSGGMFAKNPTHWMPLPASPINAEEDR